MFSSILMGLVFAGLFSAVFYVLALPYAPGETTNPTCLPGATDCTVTASVPYTGATAAIDLGAKNFTTTGTGGFGALTASSLTLTTSALTVGNGGTGISSIAVGSILGANTLNTLTAITSTSGTTYLKNASGTLSWGSIDLSVYVPYTGATGAVALGANTLSTTSGIITPKIYPAADSTTAVQINKADGTTNVLNVDTTNARVGIGTATPDYILHLKSATPRIVIEDSTTGAKAHINADSSAGSLAIMADSANSVANSKLFLGVDNNNYITIDSLGNVGIGTITPAARLQLGGNISAASWTTTGLAFDSNAATYTDTSTAAAGTVAVRTANSFGAPTFASTNAITVTDAFTLYVPKPIAGTNTTITRANSAYFEGNVGIGTTTPDQLLTVNGSVRVAGGTTSNLILDNGTSLQGKITNGTVYSLISGWTDNNVYLGGDAGFVDFITRTGSGAIRFNTAATEKMRISNGGNVGIGTVAPAGLFHVSSDTAATGLSYFTQANASADGFDQNFRKARGTGAAPTVITTADELGVINFTGYGGAAGYITGAAIKGISSGTIADSRVPGFLSFWTGTDAAPSVLTERMTILNNGNVGIGTTAPASKLDISTTSAASFPLNIKGDVDAVGASVGLRFGWYGSTDYQKGAIFYEGQDGNARGKLHFALSSSNDAVNVATTDSKMTIDYNGNVGIGTTVPQSLLDVQGPVGTGATGAGILTLATKELTIVDGDELGRINFNAPLESDGSDAILAGAAIWAEADDTFSTTVNSTELVFGTATTSAAVERMRIDSAGNVGIGTTSPVSILDISATNDAILVFKSGTNKDAGFVMGEAGASSGYLTGTEYGFRVFYEGSSSNLFKIQSMEGAGFVDRVAINRTNGNVGIGVITPAARLQLGGNISAASWTTTGLAFDSNAATYTDTSTAGAGTVAVRTANSFGAPTFASTNAITVTDAFTLYVPKPIAGTNTTITRANSAYFEGNVGIGTTTPGARLQVDSTIGQTAIFNSTATGGAYVTVQESGIVRGYFGVGDSILTNAVADSFGFRAQGALTFGSGGDNVRMTIDSTNGNVGIGTVAPAGLFHVSSDTAATGLSYFTQANASADGFDQNFRKARGTGAAPTVITTADELGVINFTGYGGAAGYITGAAIKGISSGTIADSRVPGFLSFWTGTDAAPSVLTERMTILNSGYVGIGTTSPAAQLHIQVADASGVNYVEQLRLGKDTVGSVGDGTYISWGIGSQSPAGAIGAYFNTGTTGGLRFDTSQSERMRIDKDGNVGIGTITPAARLQLGGNISAASWTTTGLAFDSNAATYTDTSTAGAGTVAVRTANSFGAPTFASTNAITVTDAFTLYVPKPIAGTNTTITRANSAYFEGNVGIGTTSPGMPLDVTGNIRSSSAFIVSTSALFGGSYFGMKSTYGFNWSDSSSTYSSTLDTSIYRLSAGVVGIGTGAGGNSNGTLIAGKVGIGTTSPTNLLSLGGTAARTFWMERNTTAATAGQGLTLSSGGAIAGTADLAGGNLTLQSGISTGSGFSDMFFQTATAGASATTDRTPSTKFTIRGDGNVVVGTGTALATTATAGFLYIPTSAGAQTGTPVADTTGTSPIVYDTTNNRLYIYNPTGTPVWKYIAITGGFQIPDYETTDPISGEKMKEGDIVLGRIDKTMSDSALHATWVSWNSVKKQLLAEARGELSKTTGAWGTGTVDGIGTETFLDKVKNVLFSLGISAKDGLTSIANLAVEKSNTEVARIKKIEMVATNGDIYCTWIGDNGEWQKVKGECSQIATAVATGNSNAQSPMPNQTPNTGEIASSPSADASAPRNDGSGDSSLRGGQQSDEAISSQSQQIIQQAQQAANNALETSQNAQQAVEQQVQQVVQQAAQSADKAAKDAVKEMKEEIKEEVKQELKNEIASSPSSADASAPRNDGGSDVSNNSSSSADASAPRNDGGSDVSNNSSSSLRGGSQADEAIPATIEQPVSFLGDAIKNSTAGLLNAMWEFVKWITKNATASLSMPMENLWAKLFK